MNKKIVQKTTYSYYYYDDLYAEPIISNRMLTISSDLKGKL